MTAFFARLQELQSGYESLNNRERALVLGALCAVIYIIWYFAITAAQNTRSEQLNADLYALNQSMMVLDAEYQVLQGTSSRDPLAPQKQELAAIEAQVAEADGRLESLAVGLISPKKLPLVMRELLKSQTDVQLLSLKTLPPEEILLSGAAPAEGALDATLGATQSSVQSQSNATDAPLKLYRYGVQLVIETGFHAAQNYLKVLEESNWQFYWTAFDYQVDRFPKAIATLHVYTLSANRADTEH